MNTMDVETALIELIRELPSIQSGDQPVEITRSTTPLADLSFFDSLLALEVTVALEGRLGISIGDQSVFINMETEEALSISEIAARVVKGTSGAGA